jgi:putative lipoprotein
MSAHTPTEALMNRTLATLALPLVILVVGACSSTPGASSAPATLSATAWTATTVGGEFVDANSPPTMDFAADGKVSGTTGCNQYSGAYEINGNEIAIGPLAMTMMLCAGPVGEQETLFGPALQGATTWAIDATGMLKLSGAGDIVAKPAS